MVSELGFRTGFPLNMVVKLCCLMASHGYPPGVVLPQQDQAINKAIQVKEKEKFNWVCFVLQNHGNLLGVIIKYVWIL